MRTIISALLGGALGFAAAVLTISAVVLLATGVGGGILVRERPGTARVLNYDPSTVVLKACVIGILALAVLCVIIIVYISVRRAERRSVASRPREDG
jgi:hypothetical protein